VDAAISPNQDRELAIFASVLPCSGKDLFGIPEKRVHKNLIATTGHSLNFG
jgi:hypothetical protein